MASRSLHELLRRFATITPAAAALPIAFACTFFARTMADAAPGDSLAFVVTLEGDAQVKRGKEPEHVFIGSALSFGDTLVVAPSSTCSVRFLDGRKLDLAGEAQLVLEKGITKTPASHFGDWVRRQLTDWLGEPSRHQLRTRSLDDWDLARNAPAPVFPAPEGSVRADRAVLSWVELTGADRYVVTLARKNEPDRIHNITGNTVRLSDLAQGADYLWKVIPDIKQWPGDSSWREFRVLAKDEEREVDRAIEKMSDLDAAIVLFGVGLHEEAIRRVDAEIEKGTYERSARLWRARMLESLGLFEHAYDELRMAGCSP